MRELHLKDNNLNIGGIEKSVNERLIFCLTMKSRVFSCTFDVLKLIA